MCIRDSPWARWRIGIREEDGHYYLTVPRGRSLAIPLRVDPSSELGQLLSRLKAYGVISQSRRGVEIPCTVTCEDGNVSVAYLLARSLVGGLEEYVARERELLSRAGFNAEEYLEDVEYAVLLLRESGEAFRRGDFEVGSGLLRKGLARAALALEALSQAKTDSVTMFLFLLTFTFFLSSITSNFVERRRGLINISLFTCLALLEAVSIPQARMALTFLSPEAMQRVSPTAMALSLLTTVLTMLLVAMVILSARGTLLSDFFWYSVKSMRVRKLRAALTVMVIAIVASVSGAFIAFGAGIVVREESYPSTFRGLSVALHTTTVTYIFRGMDEANEVIVEERYDPLTPFEVKWLSSMSWVERVYVVKIGRAVIEHGGARIPATVVATNASKFGGVAMSRSLARELGVEEGDVVSVAGRVMRVVKVFDSSSPPALLDGVPLSEVGAPLVIGDLEAAAPGSAIYRVILEGDVEESFAERLVRMSFEESVKRVPSSEADITVQVFRSYRACVGRGGTKCLVIVGVFQQLSGTPEFVVVISLASLTVAVALLGSIYERRREYSTMSALGASPGHVSLLLLVEGLSYGILGGAIGYVAGQFLLALTPSRATPLRPQALSPLLASFLVAVVPSIVGSLLPARRAALQVVPSRLLLRRVSEVKVLEDRVEAEIPLRIVGDEEEFFEYLKSLVKRPSPVSWGPVYMRVDAQRRCGRVESIEALVSFRSERAALFAVKLYLPRRPGEAIRAVALSPSGKWTVDHKSCAKDLLTALRDDLLHYVEWRKERGVGRRG